MKLEKANGAQLADVNSLLHRLPADDVLAVGLVEQQQVEVVQPKALQSRVDVLATLLVGIGLGEQFRGDEELLTGDDAVGDDLGDNLTDRDLVEVGVGGVDVPVTQLNSLAQVGMGLLRGHEVGAETNGGDGLAVVERVAGNCSHNGLLRRLITGAQAASSPTERKPTVCCSSPVTVTTAGQLFLRVRRRNNHGANSADLSTGPQGSRPSPLTRIPTTISSCRPRRCSWPILSRLPSR